MPSPASAGRDWLAGPALMSVTFGLFPPARSAMALQCQHRRPAPLVYIYRWDMHDHSAQIGLVHAVGLNNNIEPTVRLAR